MPEEIQTQSQPQAQPPVPPAVHAKTVGEALANLARLVPGFAGYKEAEDRRLSDKELRAVIGERLTGIKERLDRVVGDLSRAGKLDDLALIDETGRRLERLIDRMRFADYGYAAVFDRIQLGEKELLQIYQYDAGILQDLPAFDAATKKVEDSTGDAGQLRTALENVDELTAEFDHRFEARKHLFDGLSP